MSPSALFVTSFQQSLGETFTLARLAADLCAEGWRSEFLASEFAAGFVREQGNAVTLLTRSREENQSLVAATLARLTPDVIVTADFYLYEATDARQMWSMRWLTETGLPIVTFDHLKFHPEPRTITLGFMARLHDDPLLRRNFTSVPEGAVPRATVPISALPPGVVLFRPCPIHDPRPQPDSRVWCYDLSRNEVAANPPSAARRRLGIAEAEKVVVVPVGSWALGLARHLQLPYPDLLMRVLLRYLAPAAGRLRILLVGKGLTPAKEVRGRVTLELVPGLPFDDLRDLLSAADLVLGDNPSSATMARAVMAGVPAAVLVSSLSVHRERGRLVIDAQFPVSRFARGLIRSTEEAGPGSVFPFSVYPLGWCEEMQPLFDGNPYRDTIEWLEMFHEKESAARLSSLVFDPAAREKLIARQRTYRRLVEALPGAAELVNNVLPRNAGAVA